MKKYSIRVVETQHVTCHYTILANNRKEAVRKAQSGETEDDQVLEFHVQSRNPLLETLTEEYCEHGYRPAVCSICRP